MVLISSRWVLNSCGQPEKTPQNEICLFALGDHDQGRTQHAVGDHVALLQHGDDGVCFLLGIHHADGLVLVRIELLASRADFVQRILFESGAQLLQGQFNAGLEACTTCEVAGTVSGLQTDLLSGAIKDKLVSELQSNPDINVLHVPIDPLFQFAVEGALATVNRDDILVVGGDGLPSAIDYIRSGVSDAEVAFPHEWTAWASIDTMNRLFAGDDEYADTGIGWTLIDADHNLPASGGFTPPIDFKAAFKKVWGVE